MEEKEKLRTEKTLHLIDKLHVEPEVGVVPAKSESGPDIAWHELDLWKFTWWTSVFSVAENLYFYPISVLKTRQMTDRSGESLRQAGWVQTIQQMRELGKKEGYRVLYKGFWASSVWSTPSYILYLTTYHYVRSLLGWDDSVTRKAASQHWYTKYAPIIAALGADVAAITLSVPVDVIVQRMQLPNSRYKSAREALKLIYKEEGMAGLYRGTGISLLTTGVASSVWWHAYEHSKLFLYSKFGEPRDRYSKQAILTTLSCGAFAGALASIAINPLDVVKTRLQTQSRQGPDGLTTTGTFYKNTFHGMRVMLKEEGWRSLTRGLFPKLLQRVPTSGISTFIYELTLTWSRTSSEETSRRKKPV